MKRTKNKPKTQSLHTALRIWYKARNAHKADMKQRGVAMLDTKRLKLLLASRQAFHDLNVLFHKAIGL